MTKSLIRQIAVILTTIGTLTINGLANALPINGVTSGEVSDMYPVLFTPAGYVFSIWSVIYIGLIAFSVYQALPAQRDNPRLNKVGWLYVASGVLNSIWLLLFHNFYIVLTLPVMIALLVCLAVIYVTLRSAGPAVSTAERWTTHIPFSIYFGWITVATIVNVGVTLLEVGWGGFGISAEIWTLVLFAVALVLAAAIAYMQGDAAYLAVLVWAFIGIGVAREGNTLLVTAAYGSAAIVALLALISLIPQGPFSNRQRGIPAAGD